MIKGILKKILIGTLATVFIMSALYFFVFGNFTSNQETQMLYIPTNANYETVISQLEQSKIISPSTSFYLIAKTLKYPANVIPGKYKIEPKTSEISLLRMLKSGKQEVVNLTFNNIRTKNNLAGVLAKQIELDSITLLKHFTANDSSFLDFIPNTYEVYWNISIDRLFEKMKEEADKYWAKNNDLLAKTGLTKKEVIVLASIVQSETQKNDEKPRVAGTYINRLNKGILLQADPTLVFAHQDFTIKRVLNGHKTIDSPYNTYKYLGLPPGPICLPELSSLKAVLNFEKHNYIYFCAKEDFSGYHNFASDYKIHCKNAIKYQKALNAKQIFN